MLSGLAGTVAVPGAILLSRQTGSIRLLDAVWAIPVAAVCGVAALLFARGAGGHIRWTLEQASGLVRVRLGRILGVAGICFALSASIAVGVYELLLRLE